MLIFGDKLVDLPVGSIQTEHRIGTVSGYLLDPHKLQIIALYVRTKFDTDALILHTSDIKEFSGQGVIIDHNDRLMSPDNLVRLKEIIDINFDVNGKKVVTENGKRLGKVASFAFDTDTFLIMRINVRQSLVKNLSSSELIIHRRQIVSVTDDQIIVQSLDIKDRQPAHARWRKILLGAKQTGISAEPTPAKVLKD